MAKRYRTWRSRKVALTYKKKSLILFPAGILRGASRTRQLRAAVLGSCHNMGRMGKEKDTSSW